jgi:hypothetical protein
MFWPIAIPLLSVGLLLVLVWIGKKIIFDSGEGPGVELKRLPWFEKNVNGEQNLKVGIREASNRILWGLAGVLQTSVFIFAIAAFTRILYVSMCRVLDDIPKLPLYFVVGTLLAGAVIGIAIFWTGRTDQHDEEVAFGLQIPGGILHQACDKIDNKVLGIVIDVENGLAAIVILTGLFAIGSLLMPGHSPSAYKHDLAARKKQMRLLLNISAIALVVGVVQIHIEYQWATSLLVRPPGGDAAKVGDVWEPGAAAASSFTVAGGGIYSLCLLAAFVPAATYLGLEIGAFNENNKFAPIEFDSKDLYADAVKLAGPILTAGVAIIFKG